MSSVFTQEEVDYMLRGVSDEKQKRVSRPVRLQCPFCDRELGYETAKQHDYNECRDAYFYGDSDNMISQDDIDALLAPYADDEDDVHRAEVEALIEEHKRLCATILKMDKRIRKLENNGVRYG